VLSATNLSWKEGKTAELAVTSTVVASRRRVAASETMMSGLIVCAGIRLEGMQTQTESIYW
jgi:hypothetical protein